MAKGLGGGFPLSAVTGRATIMDAAHAGGLGGTYGGNPISIAAAHAVLDVIESEGLCARAATVGDKMRARLQALAKELPCIGDVRGLGAMVAFELVKDPKTKEPDAELTAAVLTHAETRGLILLSCGTSANVVRLLAPLTIPDAVLAEGLDILRGSACAMRTAAAKSKRGASLRSPGCFRSKPQRGGDPDGARPPCEVILLHRGAAPG